MDSSLIENILFPTDFSDNAGNALSFALEIAGQTGATLHILHSIEEPYDFAPLVKETNNNINQKVEQLYDKMLKEIRQDEKYENLSIETYIQTGRVIYSLLEESRTRNVDLIVMGTKGRSGVQKVLFGSTTAEMIQQSEIPVLAIPREAIYSGFEQILFATEYQDGDLAALEYATELAELFKSNIRIIHASEEQSLKADALFRGFKQLVEETISYKNIDFYHATAISLFEVVADQIELHDISLLVMTRYQKSLSAFKRKHTKEMSFYTEVPLLVLPESN